MISKVCSFPGVSPHTGERLIFPIHPGGAQDLIKTAQAIHPAIQKYLLQLRPDPADVYALLIALGSSEYYGQNINGDIFPEKALRHRGIDYGYQTFLQGHVFRHHQNKDPNVSFGGIPLSVWNAGMQRVELIIRLSRVRAHQFSAQDIVAKIDAGIPLSVSMGCKVPFDICTICGNKAPTKNEYCYHLLHEMNKIYPDGRQVGAINTRPKFFDLSFVFIGADQIAKTLCKVASGGCCEICAAVAELKKEAKVTQPREEMRDDVRMAIRQRLDAQREEKVEQEQRKEASIFDFAKMSRQRKIGDIFKDSPSNFVVGTIPHLERAEPNLPHPVLDSMAQGSLGDALSTASMAGIVLKPQEFQRVCLIRMGQRPLADRLEQRGEVFGPSEQVDTVSTGSFLPDLFNRLRPYLPSRSGFGPFLRIRIIQIVVQPKQASVQTFSKRGLLRKIANAYNGYRIQTLLRLPQDLPTALEQHPQLSWELLKDELLDSFSKEAAGRGPTTLKVLLGTLPIFYFLSAHWKAKEMYGQHLGFLRKFVAEHPEISSLLMAGAIGQLRPGQSTLVK